MLCFKKRSIFILISFRHFTVNKEKFQENKFIMTLQIQKNQLYTMHVNLYAFTIFTMDRCCSKCLSLRIMT